jgi:hypothetical protein
LGFFTFKEVSVPNIQTIRYTTIYDKAITYIDAMTDICVAAHLFDRHYLEEIVKYISQFERQYNTNGT